MDNSAIAGIQAQKKTLRKEIRRKRLALSKTQQKQAAVHRFEVRVSVGVALDQHHGACATFTFGAAFFGAGQVPVTEKLQNRRVRIEIIDLEPFAIQ